MYLVALTCNYLAWILFIVYAAWWWLGSTGPGRTGLFAVALSLWFIGWLAKRKWQRQEFTKALREVPWEEEDSLRREWKAQGMSAPRKVNKANLD